MVSGSIIIVGSGGHARSCVDVIEQQQDYCIDGFITEETTVDWCRQYPVLGADADLEAHWQVGIALHIAIGQIRNFQTRKKLYEFGLSLAYVFPAIVSPYAYVSPSAIVGAGTIIMHGAVVNAGARIGVNSIINTRALIEHDGSIGDHCHISTGAIVNGATHVGDCCFIGSGAVLRQSLDVPAQSFIKMGTIVSNF